jgi:small subunit ribosomal protein S16
MGKCLGVFNLILGENTFMALKIRLRQQGRSNRQTFRLVVTDIRNPRDGKYLEMVGWYNPFSTTQDCSVDVERINYWVGRGAQITPSAQALITRIAPDTMKGIRAKEHTSRVKKTAKRRAAKKAKAAPIAEAAAAPKAAPKKAAKKTVKA